MDKARLYFSRKGELCETIKARDIRSREHYRGLWPLVSEEDPPTLVSWVSPVIENGKLVRRSHFRAYSGRRHVNANEILEDEEAARSRHAGESAEHRLAKQLIAEELAERIAQGLALPWAFKDDSVSDFHLEGNLLRGATSVETEVMIKAPPPLTARYRLDVAVLGEAVLKNRPVLAGIEIEYEHAFDGRKAIAGRATGYPLVSIDISSMSLEELTPQWAKRALTETTHTALEGRRKTFIYLNPLLYPLYIKLPQPLFGREKRHQFVIFASDAQLETIRTKVDEVRQSLMLKVNDVVLQMPSGKSEQSAIMLANLGDIVGDGWERMNPNRCLTISLDRPSQLGSDALHLMHLFIAIYLAGWADALVGYKWSMGIINEHPESDLWDGWREGKRYNVAPKRLSIPFVQYIAAINRLRIKS